MLSKINPIEIVKVFKEDKRKSKEDVYNYLKSIAREASEISNIWEEIVQTLIDGNSISELKRKELLKRLNNNIELCNGCNFSRLQSFYTLTSRAVGNKLNSIWLDDIIHSISNIVFNRNLTKKGCQNIINDFGKIETKSENSYDQRIQMLVESVKKLRAESEYLYVLAENSKLEKTK